MKNTTRNKSNKPPSETRDKEARGQKGETAKGDHLPGDYPPSEDIMNRRDTNRIGLDVENFSRAIGIENSNKTKEPIITRRNDIMNENEEPGNVSDLEDSRANEMEHPVPRDLHLDEDDADLINRNESDVTEEDLEALGPKDLSMDMGEDENLKHRVWPVDMAGEDLDVPGAEEAGRTDDQGIGPNDEENDFYSLGGDRHEDNLEGK